MPVMTIPITAPTFSAVPKGYTFNGTLKLPQTVFDPIRINSANLYWGYARLYVQGDYLNVTSGDTGFNSDIFSITVDTDLKERDVNLYCYNVGTDHILKVQGRSIKFVITTNVSTSGNIIDRPRAGDMVLTLDYDITTTACTPPTALSVSAVLAESNVTLNGSGAAGGVTNGIVGYEVQYNDDYAGWAGLTTASTTSSAFSISVAPPARGVTRRFRARTLGSAGSGYYSDWKESTNGVKRNSVPIAPGYVNVSPAIYESGNITITWAQGSDPDGNLSYYKVQYQIVGGAWTDLVNTSALNTTQAPALTRGATIKYRVCSVDAFGVASGYTESGTVKRNQTPLTPAFSLPMANGETYSLKPSLVATVGPEPDGQSQTMQLSIDGGSYVSIGAVASAGGTVYYQMSLAAGTHTLTLRVADSLGAAGGTAVRTITVKVADWSRPIATGTIIAGGELSHVADINELLSKINVCRGFYGLSKASLTGTVGEWAQWKTQVMELQTALGACFSAAGKALPAWNTAPSYPAAAIMTQLRSQCVAC